MWNCKKAWENKEYIFLLQHNPFLKYITCRIVSKTRTNFCYTHHDVDAPASRRMKQKQWRHNALYFYVTSSESDGSYRWHSYGVYQWWIFHPWCQFASSFSTPECLDFTYLFKFRLPLYWGLLFDSTCVMFLILLFSYYMIFYWWLLRPCTWFLLINLI